jgi:hypothetical protein
MTGAYEWVLTAVIGFCALLILLNWADLVSWFYARSRRGTKSGFSFAPPYLCGMVASGALLAYPRAGLHRFFWVPLAADPSIGFVFLFSALQRVVRWFRKR